MTTEFERLKFRLDAGHMSRREFLGRASALGLSAAAASVLPKSAMAGEPIKGGHLKIATGNGASTDTLDPAYNANDATFLAHRHCGETLLNVTPSSDLEHRLAEEFASKDNVTWQFKIRKGVEFHNGKPVTAEDVLKTIERHSDEKSKSGARGLLTDIDRLSADGDTFKVTLKSPNADFAYYMADFHLVIQPNGGKDDPATGIAAGPYIVEANQPGVRYAFKKFPNYWDSNIGHVAESEVLVINDATARNGALQSGRVHMINLVDPKVADLLKGKPGISIKNVSGRGHYTFPMHVDTSPFDNEDLRMALKLAIDRDEMVDKILRGFGSVGNDMPVNASYPLFDTSIPQRRYDPEQAAAFYKKSGHDGTPIVLRTADSAFPGAVEAAQLFQQSAAKAGIPIEVRREPSDGYDTQVWNKQPFCASYWGGRPTQDQMYSTVYLSTAAWNDTRFKNADFDRFLMAARSELDPAKRKKNYSEMGLILRDKGGVIVPVFNDWIDAVSDKVGGFVPDPNWGLMNNMAGLKCWLVA
ncbi:peptide ABC transporter substrate-binding protein [Mesorhizobium tianshanense]|uniref:Peptide/nickel transport system substrate-binding protein n=1 Tax=Mesorhizobium tianshanense TaxID=39844 RepID=A0A562N3X8_9HYPH|nr:ABC transporter substrate-binding protein [Mesorhizobium tianshanense]TWI26865.1 peptide/nickel transport system substrate-binding protein [Mesorhizobium tianshanense]GLS40293.1 peptide ABC transporter substrate-binding protein [Mesorhizobium tianshanense]